MKSVLRVVSVTSVYGNTENYGNLTMFATSHGYFIAAMIERLMSFTHQFYQRFTFPYKFKDSGKGHFMASLKMGFPVTQ